MTYRLKYSDYSTTASGPPDPAAWVGPPGPPGPPGPTGISGTIAGLTNVKDYGAKGDGTTDDAGAFQAALAAAAAGGDVFVPAGTYNIGAALSQAVTGGVTFEGAGSGATILNFSAATDGVAFSLSPAANVHVRGMTIARTVAGAAYANTGLSIVTPADQGAAPRLGLITIEDVVLRGNASRSTAWATGVNLNNTNTVRVNTVMVLMPNASGAGTGVGIAHAGQSATSYAADTVFSNVTVQGGGIGLSIGDWVQGVYVVNSQLIAVDYGIRWPGVAGHSDIALLVANTHINASSRGIYVSLGGGLQVVNTLVLHWTTASVTSDWAAFEIIGHNSAMLSNNNISGWTSFSGTEHAVLMNACNFCTVIGNTISGVKNDAIVLISNTFNTTITCNNAVNMGPGAKLLSDTSGNATNQNLLNQIGGVLDLTMNASGTAIYSGAATGTVSLGTSANAFSLAGVPTNSNAAAGQVGEYISATTPAGAPVVLTTGVAATIASISLTAGDWDVWAAAGFSPGATTTISSVAAGINITPSMPGPGNASPAAYSVIAATLTTGASQVMALAPTRVSAATTTTVYMLAQASFGVAAMSGFGTIEARRRR